MTSPVTSWNHWCRSISGASDDIFALSNQQDFAIAAVGDDAPNAPMNCPRLFHVAFKIGTRIDELRAAKLYLEAAGLEVEAYDHEVSKSIYFKYPDSNTVELVVDTSDVWKQRPATVASGIPFEL